MNKNFPTFSYFPLCCMLSNILNFAHIGLVDREAVLVDRLQDRERPKHVDPDARLSQRSE